MVDVGFVKPDRGGGVEVVVAEGCDVAGGCVEPCAGPSAARGVVNGHGSSVECVVACGRVGFADEGCELFLLVFGDGGLGRDLREIRPERRVDVVCGGVELCFCVG